MLVVSFKPIQDFFKEIVIKEYTIRSMYISCTVIDE